MFYLISRLCYTIFLLLCTIVLVPVYIEADNVKELQENDLCKNENSQDERYLLFAVNPGEGFNLRRDVFLRMANLIRKINDIQAWTLILPPWGHLYHWKSEQRDKFYPWKDFFDVKSINKWITVIELQDFLKKKETKIDSTFVLQHFAEGWGADFEEKYEQRPCIDSHKYRQISEEKWSLRKWNEDLEISNLSCLSFQGHASYIIPLLADGIKNSRTVFLDRAETMLHDDYAGRRYWSARRSLRFAAHLVLEAQIFRRRYLNSDDVNDLTVVSQDWRDFKPDLGSALGGPYVAVHMRRDDFLYARKSNVPSIVATGDQLRKLLERLDLRRLFVATDASKSEMNELASYLEEFDLERFIPSSSFLWGDGGVAIVDQIICSHARFFIGTFESTFSFRIQEEREILGFSSESTFNRLCGDQEPRCTQPTRWNIVY